MYILAIDTATNAGGVALGRNNELVALWMSKSPLRYSESLVSWVDFVLGQEGLQLSDIGCFAVTTGPGSFTGLRIGLAAVKAFSQVLVRPVFGVSTLHALAYRFRHNAEYVVPLIDARRQQVYAAVYRTGPSACTLVGEEAVARPDQWLGTLPAEREYLFVGDGAVLYKSTVSALMPGSRLIESDNSVLRELIELAQQWSAAGQVGQGLQLKGNYLRPPDAKLPKPRQT